MKDAKEGTKNGFVGAKGKRKLELLLIIGLAAAILAVFVSSFTDSTDEVSGDYSQFEKWCLSEQTRAEEALGRIKGAGKVKVLITYISASEKVYATKTVSKTSNGVTTVTEEIVFSSGKPVVVTEKAPKIGGIVVVADGAGDARVKLEIIRAIMTLFDIQASDVEVFAAK